MASEMVNYSKNNILAQAEQSMLAQANQSNQVYSHSFSNYNYYMIYFAKEPSGSFV